MGGKGIQAAANLVAFPNPVPEGAGPGTTTIAWSTGDGSPAQVYLSVDGGPEQLFARGSKGSREAPWINAGGTYEFRLYGGETDRKAPLSSVTVTRSDVPGEIEEPITYSSWEEHSNGVVSDRPDGEVGAREPPVVSVVIPCYNQGHFLGEAIESVLAQSYPLFEVVVVDDGSTDNTSEVAARYPGVRCVRQRNQGLAAARNSGLAESKGNYMVFLDADDRLLPDALEVGLEGLEAHPECAFVSGRCKNIAVDGSPLPSPQPSIPRDHYEALLRGFPILIHTLMYRRSVFESISWFDTSLKAGEDYDLHFRIARKFSVNYHNHIVAEYRQHETNMSSDFELMWRSVLTIFRSQWEYVKGHEQYEGAYKSGIASYQNYYSDGLLKKARTQSARRIREIESLLSAQVQPQQCNMLAQELRRLYEGAVEIFDGKRIADTREPRDVELQRCIYDLAVAKDAARSEMDGRKQALQERLEYPRMSATEAEATSAPEDEFSALVLEARDQLLGKILIQRVRVVVRATLPPNATVIVVSKGAEELLRLDVQQAWHFPQNEEGVYAGYYPADSAEVVAHLEELREKGAGFLLFPSTSLWWLEHYPEFKQHLDAHYQLIRSGEPCTIYRLSEPVTEDVIKDRA